MTRKYIYDDEQARFKASKNPARNIVLKVFGFFVFSVAVAVVSYVLLVLVFSTNFERELRQENRMYAKIYPELEKKEKLLADVVAGLQLRDDQIYSEIFHTEAPDADRLFSSDFISVSDLISKNEDISSIVKEGADYLILRSERIEANFRAIFERLSVKDYKMPPMSLPIHGFNYVQAGATVGQKISPFYKVKIAHHGLDMIVHIGTEVFATAGGTVLEVSRSSSGQGNVVGIAHEGGYVTRYAHLQDILVYKGQTVHEGMLIGHSGMTGMAFAPHLHYEVLKDGNILDPVNYFFHDVTPDEYSDIVIMSVSIDQSMD